MIAGPARCPTPPIESPKLTVPPLLVGARHAVPVFRVARAKLRLPRQGFINARAQRHKPSPTVNLTPLYATFTKYVGVPLDTAPLRAQIPVAPVHTAQAQHAAPAFSVAPTSTVNLSPLSATFTKTGGVPLES
jgi:hypothetical protein